jgi:hypothetical protein
MCQDRRDRCGQTDRHLHVSRRDLGSIAEHYLFDSTGDEDVVAADACPVFGVHAPYSISGGRPRPRSGQRTSESGCRLDRPKQT